MAVKISKKTFSIIMAILLVVIAGGVIGMVVGFTYTPRSSVLKIYNWEDYIEDDLLDDFEDYYRTLTGNKKFKVEYHTFTDNEELYTKIKTQQADYDLAFPSEYMVEKMRDENLLLKIDTSKIDNYHRTLNDIPNLDQDILTQTAAYTKAPATEYDLTGTNDVWAVPYFVGTLGIMYDTATIDYLNLHQNTGISSTQFEDLLTQYGWGVLFGKGGTTVFKGHITMKKSARDSIGIAMLNAYQSTIDALNADLDLGFITQAEYTANLSAILNMQSKTDDYGHAIYTLQDAETTLLNQADQMYPTYENDNGKKSFLNPNNHDFAYGLYWSCDAGLVMNENEAIKFYVPTGTNLWTDNFVMPVYGKNTSAAYEFINFMLDPQNAAENIAYVGSGMAVNNTQDLAIEIWEDDDFSPSDNYLATVFPDEIAKTHSAIMHNFASAQETAVNELMINVMNHAASLGEGGGTNWFLIILGVILVVAVLGGVIYYLTHRRRAR